MDYREFEDLEQEIFLDKHYKYESVRLLIPNLHKTDYQPLREKTKKGIKAGINDFLTSQEDTSTLYLSDLAQFCFDNSTESRIKEELISTGLNQDNLDIYTKDVCESFRGFVYNESKNRFDKLFK